MTLRRRQTNVASAGRWQQRCRWRVAASRAWPATQTSEKERKGRILVAILACQSCVCFERH
eukprot:4945571-Pleurochrysis_carterae.AAC.2